MKSKRTLGPAPLQEQPRHQQRDISGEIVRIRQVGPFTLSENLYPSGLVLPRHSHSQAYITFVIEGTVRERYAGGTITCRPGTVRFLPAGEVSDNEVEYRLRCLHISTEAQVLESLDRHAVVPQRPAEISGLSAAWLANRLYAEFSREDTASAIAIEGLVLEILAEIARSQTRSDSVPVPHWLKHATDIVESRFLERLSLATIASEVGVHYVHLSRQFHKYNRCTIGELIRRRRVQHASYLLAHSHTPLAEIALMCGFSDQSHLSFLFKRYMGLSPSKFRSLAGLGVEAGPLTEPQAVNDRMSPVPVR
jgi:AraC family transcriptional regulator